MLKRLAWLMVFGVFGGNLIGYAQMVDTLAVKRDAEFKLTDYKAYKIGGVAVPLIVEGLIASNYRYEVKGIRDAYAEGFDCCFDDVTWALPAVAMLGLKCAGVEGRSSWGRMITADAMSVAITGAMVYALKYSVGEMRPDGSNNRSFPSAHTAMAFAAATMLHKEYGAVNPWYSVGGYAMATATGVGRILNDKHWANDVLVGAGIGILSTELGYWITDLIFKDKGLNDIKEYDFEGGGNSFLGLYMGISVPFGSCDLGDSSLKLSSGADVGVEGAYFFNDYVGVGGDATFADMYVEMDGVEQSNPLNMVMCHVGGYFSYPMPKNWSVGAKCALGYANYDDMIMDDGVTVLGDRDGFSMKSGVSLSFRASDFFSVRVFADYCLTNSFVGGDSGVAQSLVLGNTLSIAF